MSLRSAQINMVGQQIRCWNMLDREVLNAFDSIPRDRFVPESYLEFACADMAIPISEDQTMLEPKVVARMIDALDLHASQRVLEVGAGTGYSAAVMAILCQQVVSLEIDAELARLSRANIDSLNIDNVEIVEADCFDYCSLQSGNAGNFDKILVTGSVPELSPLFLPLVAETGRVVGIQGHEPTMHAVACNADGTRKSLFETFAPRLKNVMEPASFTF